MSMDTASAPNARSTTAWAIKLMDCPRVTLLDADARQARVEIDGIRGRAWNGDGGLCLGLHVAAQDAEPRWLGDTTLWLAAIPEAGDDALSRLDTGWILWRRFDHALSAAQLDERIPALLALVNQLVESARPTDGSTASEIGRLI
jgi:hypothetical protein